MRLEYILILVLASGILSYSIHSIFVMRKANQIRKNNTERVLTTRATILNNLSKELEGRAKDGLYFWYLDWRDEVVFANPDLPLDLNSDPQFDDLRLFAISYNGKIASLHWGDSDL